MSSEINAVIDISVQPKSSRSLITLDAAGNVKVYLNSPPVDGKANEECIKLFSQMLKVAKGRVSIDKGEKGKKKRVVIEGISREDFFKIIGSK
jgi:uncharacterized protein (TIGR00251 family)